MTRSGWWSLVDGPVLHPEARHREVGHVGGGQRRPDAHGGGRDEAVDLVQGDPTFGVVSSPRPGPDTLGHTERRQAKASEESARRRFLGGSEPTPDLLDGDGAHPWLHPGAPERGDPTSRRAPAQGVDQNSGVEQQASHSAGSASVGAPLVPDPAGTIASSSTMCRRMCVPLAHSRWLISARRRPRSGWAAERRPGSRRSRGGGDGDEPGAFVVRPGEELGPGVSPAALAPDPARRVCSQVVDPRRVVGCPGIGADDDGTPLIDHVGDEDRAGRTAATAGRHKLEHRLTCHPAPETAARQVPHQLVQLPLASHRRPVRRSGLVTQAWGLSLQESRARPRRRAQRSRAACDARAGG